MVDNQKSIKLRTQHRKHGAHVGTVERGHVHGASASHIWAAERLVERGRGRRAGQCGQQRGREGKPAAQGSLPLGRDAAT